MSRGCPVIPHSDVVAQSSRAPTRDPKIPASLLVRFSFLDPASLCGVTRFSTRDPGIPASVTRKIHFSGPRITCGVTPFVMPPSMRSPSHPVPRCGIQRIPSSVIPSSNAAPWSCRLRCGHQVIPHPMRDPENTVCTPRETARAVGMHGLCILPVTFTSKGP